MTGESCACPGSGSALQDSNHCNLRLADAVSGVVRSVSSVDSSTYAGDFPPPEAPWKLQRLVKDPLVGRRWSEHLSGPAGCPDPGRFLAAIARSLAVGRPMIASRWR